MNSEVLVNQNKIQMLKSAVEKNTTAIMSHMSRGKWHMTKVYMTFVGESTVHVEIAPREKQLPINIQIDQPIGLTFKLGFNKYIFQSVITGLEPSVNKEYGGKLILDMPVKIECMQKRSYFRVQPPESLNVKAFFWHRGYNDDCCEVPEEDYWEGSLLDLSAGGLQIGVDIHHKPNFKSGQLVGIQFTPMPNQHPISLEGQIRHMAKTADEKNLCLGIQIVGLEASQEGREKLKKLVRIVEEYEKINQTESRKKQVLHI